MAALDLVVSVDSAPLHLAGAMGRPCVGLIPEVPCWRWGFATDRTPWYPSMRLLRQSKHGDWSGPLHQLHHLVGNRLADPIET
jgi:ADP-heptose:LPS heptosyltransferase